MKRAWLEWAQREQIDATLVVTRFGFRPVLGQPPSEPIQRFDFREPGPLQGTELNVIRASGKWFLLQNGQRIAEGATLGNFGDEIRRIEQGR